MEQQVIVLKLNHQQLELIDRTVERGVASDRVALVRLALREYAAKHGRKMRRRPAGSRDERRRAPQGARPPPGGAAHGADRGDHASARELLFTHRLEPGTGKAIELRRGQILRIEQIEGGQCVDFNCFNLDDYKEYMHTGRTRTLHGLYPTAGHFMWSAPPRERALIYILEDTAHCNDVMFPRCSANLYESLYGLPVHTNCHDIQSEAQREYGLTPDDVHDSFNLFMKTGVDPDGKPVRGASAHEAGRSCRPARARRLACRPQRLRLGRDAHQQFLRSSRSSCPCSARPKPISRACPHCRPSRPSARPPTSRSRPSRPTGSCAATPPTFRSSSTFRCASAEIPVALDAEERLLFERCRRSDLYGDDDGAALRDILFTWWEERYVARA